MTKQTEIALLDTLIARLGRDSYLGPWLADNRAAIVRDLQNDFYPTAPLPAEAHREARAILLTADKDARALRAQATAKAAETLEAAQAEYRRIVNDARSSAAEIRADVRRAAERLINAL